METATIQTAPPAPQLIQLPPAGRIFKQAMKFYAGHWPIIIGISAVPLIFSLPQVLGKDVLPSLAIAALAVLSAVAGLVARVAFFGAVVENGAPAGGVAGAYAKGMNMLFPFLWVSILTTLAALGGFVLLVVPGILVSLWLSMSAFSLFAENRKGAAALVASWHYVKGYLGSVFLKGLFLGMIIWLALAAGAIVFSLAAFAAGEISYRAGEIAAILFGELVATPLSIIYFYFVYQSLKYAKSQMPIETEESELRKKVVIFLVLGLVALLIIAAVAAVALYWYRGEIGPMRFSPPRFDTSSAGAPWRTPLASMGFAPILDFLSFGR